MKARTPFVVGLTLLTLMFAGGCDDGSDSGLSRCEDGEQCPGARRSIDRLEVALSEDLVVAGRDVQVACTAVSESGATEPLLDFEIELSPSNGVQIAGETLRTSVAGEYDVRCRSQEIVSAPAILTVEPAEAIRLVTLLDKTDVVSGETVTAACIVEDAEGNRIELGTPTLRTRPLSGITVDGLQLITSAANEYEVTCRLDVLISLETISQILTVRPAAPAHLVTTLSRYTVSAGTRVDVECRVEDTAGNAVDSPWSFEIDPGVSDKDATGFTPIVSGSYDVGCTVPGLSSTPVPLTVTASAPASLAIVGVTPAKPIYDRGEEVTVDLDIRDRYGNEASAAIEMDGLPQGAVVSAGPQRANLIGDGSIELIARVRGPTHEGREVSDSVTVIVDGSPPEINWTYPQRGEIITGLPGGSIVVRGQAVDALGTATNLMINGEPVVLDASGNFLHVLDAEWGINLIEGAVSDQSGNVRGFARAFEYASSYKRASPSRQVSGRISDGLIAHLGQQALDDNNADVDDLATIAKLAIENLDVGSLIPRPVTTFNSDCSILFVTITGRLRLYVDDVRYGTPRIDITAINGGLRVRAEIPNVAVDMHTSGDVCDIGLGLSGSASASRIVVTGNLVVSDTGGLTVSMPTASVQIYGLNINLNLPSIIDWAVDGIINLFSGAIANELESAFRDVIRSEIPGVVQEFLESLMLDTGFDLPSPLSLRLNLGAGLGLVDFAPGGGEIGLDTTIFAQPAMSPEPIGGILQNNVVLPTFAANRAFAIGIGYDLINQALYSMWFGGGLDIDVGALAGSFDNGGSNSDFNATASTWLPPVLAPSNDPSYPVELQVGDLELFVDVDGVDPLPPIAFTMYATIYAKANVTLGANGELSIELGPNPEIALELESSLDQYLDTATFAVELEAILSDFIPQIFGEVIGGIPIPSFDLSTLSGGFLPPGIVLGLGNGSTRFSPSYLLLEGDLVQIP